MKENAGYMVIELTHDGIPDADLVPEDFSEFQLSVLKQLDLKMQELISAGNPISVIDKATGATICEFNKCNFQPSQAQIDEVGKSLAELFQRMMSNPEKRAKYEEWKKNQPPRAKHKGNRKRKY